MHSVPACTTLFQALHWSSLAGVTTCICQLECSTIGFIMHSFGVCLAMVHCTSIPCIYIYILYLFCSHIINYMFTVQPSQNAHPSRIHPSQQVPRAFSLSASCLFMSSNAEQRTILCYSCYMYITPQEAKNFSQKQKRI